MELNQLHYPFSEQMSKINGFVSKEKKKTYRVGLGRDQLEHLASPMTKSESKYQWIQDKSEMIEKRRVRTITTALLPNMYFFLQIKICHVINFRAGWIGSLKFKNLFFFHEEKTTYRNNWKSDGLNSIWTVSHSICTQTYCRNYVCL